MMLHDLSYPDRLPSSSLDVLNTGDQVPRLNQAVLVQQLSNSPGNIEVVDA